MKKCSHILCSSAATTSWALVPICRKHREKIEEEHAQYYQRRIISINRRNYMDIYHLTPWGKDEKFANI